MTPEEAREIDRLEFEADCRAARERAYALVETRCEAEQKRRRRLSGFTPATARAVELQQLKLLPRLRSAPLPRPQPLPRCEQMRRKRSGKVREAFGLAMTLAEWADHLGIKLNNLHQRIHVKGSLENAIASMGGLPGVVRNLAALEGTGGGPVAQDISEIEFSH